MKNIMNGRFFMVAMTVIVIFITFPGDNTAESGVFSEKKENFRNHLSKIAKEYIGLPFQFGGNPEQTGTVDNSHLFCTIYERAATAVGLKFRGYIPMNLLLDNTVEVQGDELTTGDLIVLNDGHAALIYDMEGPHQFHMLYASEKRQEVVSFSSQNVVYDAYWLKSLKGFFRLNENLFEPEDA
jgi:hypothetical protein